MSVLSKLIKFGVDIHEVIHKTHFFKVVTLVRKTRNQVSVQKKSLKTIAKWSK